MSPEYRFCCRRLADCPAPTDSSGASFLWEYKNLKVNLFVFCTMESSYLCNLVSGDEASFEHAWGLLINDFLNAVPMVREELRQAVVVKAEFGKVPA